MMWEVAARRGREFPRSMSDFKPGELYFTFCRFLALDICLSGFGVDCAFMRFLPEILSFRLLKGRLENTRQGLHRKNSYTLPAKFY